MGWFGIWFALIFTTILMACSLGWALLSRYASTSVASRYAEKIARLPSALWVIAGSAFFLLPVLAYWLSAHSHGNAIAGFLPWNDAAGYFGCAESYLLGSGTSSNCAKRPLYTALFTDLLWLTGNDLQKALLLQAAFLGGAAVLFLRVVSQDMNGPALLAGYSVLFLFAAKFCAALVMTENVGFLFGCIALALLWHSARDAHWLTFCIGIAVMAAALNARAGAMLVLPAAIGWALFHSGVSPRRRVVLAGLGLAAAVAGLTVSTLPTLVIEGKLEATQSNFSYVFYGLAVGGKGWLQVIKDHPEIFTKSGGAVGETQAIYGAAFESILSRPHLLAFGYVKGLVHYFTELFKFAHDFKPLRFLIFIPLWLAGIWYAAIQWRDPRYALLFWLQIGILASSPFITFDGGNRIYAATMPIDALFVGMGVMWISAHLQPMFTAGIEHQVRTKGSVALALAGIAMILVPMAALVAIRLGSAKVLYSQPVCASGLEGVVVRPGRSSLVLPLVATGEETVFPLRVLADHLDQRLHKTVHNAFEFSHEPGTTFVWGIRLDAGKFGQQIFFVWKGTELTAGEAIGFCVKRPESGSGRNLGVAMDIHRNVSLR